MQIAIRMPVDVKRGDFVSVDTESGKVTPNPNPMIGIRLEKETIAKLDQAAAKWGMIEIIVYGIPGPQGSKKHVGGGRMIESSKKVKPWREAIYWAVRDYFNGPPQMIRGAVIVNTIYTLPKPKNAPKNRVTYPDRYPDVDKLDRATFDGLTKSGVIEDDSRIIGGQHWKWYPNGGPDALDRPGAVIRIRALDAL